MSTSNDEFRASIEAMALRTRAELAERAGSTSVRHPAYDTDLVDSVRAALGAWTPLRWVRMSNADEVRHGLTQAARGRARTVPDATYAPASPSPALAGRNLRHLAKQLAGHPIASTLHSIADAEPLTRAIGKDDREVTHRGIDLYGLPTSSTVERAHAILSDPPSDLDEEGSWDPCDVAAVTRHVLHRDGLGQWQVRVDHGMAATRMAVDNFEHTVAVSSAFTFTNSEVRRLLIHEVGAHVFQTTNAENQPDPLAVLGSTPATTEGLAAVVEDRLGVLDSQTLRRYAARAVAVDLATRVGAVDIVRALEPTVGLEEAVRQTLRVKRGLRKIDQPGVFSKDHAYLSGYLTITDLVRRDEENYRTLMATKWGVEHRRTVQAWLAAGRLTKPLHIPDLRFAQYVYNVTVDSQQWRARRACK